MLSLSYGTIAMIGDKQGCPAGYWKLLGGRMPVWAGDGMCPLFIASENMPG